MLLGSEQYKSLNWVFLTSLSHFGVPFWCKASDSLGFVAQPDTTSGYKASLSRHFGPLSQPAQHQSQFSTSDRFSTRPFDRLLKLKALAPSGDRSPCRTVTSRQSAQVPVHRNRLVRQARCSHTWTRIQTLEAVRRARPLKHLSTQLTYQLTLRRR